MRGSEAPGFASRARQIPKLFAKHFQIQRFFLQRFPKISLAVLRDFKGLQVLWGDLRFSEFLRCPIADERKWTLRNLKLGQV